MEKQSNTLSPSLLEEAYYYTKTENGKQDILIAWAELLKIHCRYLGKKEGGHATVGEDMASAERC